MTEEYGFHFIIGVLVGVFGAISSAYLLFQTKGGCREMQESCAERNKILQSQTSSSIDVVIKELKELRVMIEVLRDELEKLSSKVDKKMAAMIVSMPVPDEKKQEMLRSW